MLQSAADARKIAIPYIDRTPTKSVDNSKKQNLRYDYLRNCVLLLKYSRDCLYITTNIYFQIKYRLTKSICYDTLKSQEVNMNV